MKITAISRQKRRQDRYSLYLDGKYAVSLSENQLLEAGLRIGDELDEARLAQLGEASEFGKALDRAYNYLSYRARSHREVADYLRRKQYDEELIAQLLERLVEQKAINDLQFALDWIENRQLLSPRSQLQLQTELRQKGIDRDTIEQALQQAQLDDPIETVKGLIESKRLLNRYDDPQKLIRHLAGKGFRIDTIKAALEQLTDAEPN